jgi:N-acyl-D-aspartate/D-glutamate deacylase
VVDGSGAEPVSADVGIVGSTIADIGSLSGSAVRTIDADGLVVSPGFIDHHTHMDAQILWDPYATSEPQNGITSIVMGNCGLTLAPVRPGRGDDLLKSFVRVEAMNRAALEIGIPWTWNTYGDYLDTISKRLGVNVGGLVGHIAIREYVLGSDSTERAATEAEIAEMKTLVHDALTAGALGMSTNRNQRHMREDGKPVPSRLATDDEVIALGGVLDELNAGIIETVHETPPRADQIDWYAKIAGATHRPLVWQAIQPRWDVPELWKEQLAATQRAFSGGVKVYPTTSTFQIVNRVTLKTAQIFDEFPTWRRLMFLPLPARMEAFRDAETRQKMRSEWKVDHPTTFHRRWDLIKVVATARPENEKYLKQTVEEVAREQGKDPLDAFLDLALSEELETEFQSAGREGDPDVLTAILQSPEVLIGLSDAGAHTSFQAGFGYATRLLGTWVRDRGALTLEQAIYRLTSQVASVYGIKNRGLLSPGYAADVTIFDPATINAGDAEPANDYPGGGRRMVQPSSGIQYTIVNGRPIYEEGRLTGDLPGQLLRGAAYKAA